MIQKMKLRYLLKRHKRKNKFKVFSTRLTIKIKAIWLFMQRENFDLILITIVFLVIFSSLGFYLVEPNKSLLDSFWWSFVTLTTLGYGDIIPTTLVGRMIAIIDMILGIGILTILSANIASILVDRRIRQDLGMNSYKFDNHIIICEWNYRAKLILKELRHELQMQQKPIVLIADIEHKPVNDPNLFFVRGEVSDDTLNQANLENASTVIILGDQKLDYKNRDAKVILNTLTVESIYPDVYTIVELVDETYIPTCKRAHADEIIVSSNLTSKLISHTAINHGISRVITDLITYEHGNQIYKMIVPDSKIGSSFMELLIYMKETYQTIIIGIQSDQNGTFLANPQSNYILKPNDYLIVIGASKNNKSFAELKLLINQ
jgi:voltage-gated potassium channel